MKSPIRVFAGIICMAGGIVWSVFFPKTGDWLRPDFVASVAVGLGLIVPGIILLLGQRIRGVTTALAILLVESLLLNVFLFSLAREALNFVQTMVEQASIK